MNTMVWLVAMIVLIVIEIVTVGLTTIWFAIGSMAAVLVSVLGGSSVLQTSVFLAVSFILLIFTRPLAVKYINKSRVKTNSEGVIGKVVRVTEDVDNVNETGCAVVNGVDWTVRSINSEKRFVAGQLVKVVDIQGVKLMVEEYVEDTAAAQKQM